MRRGPPGTALSSAPSSTSSFQISPGSGAEAPIFNLVFSLLRDRPFEDFHTFSDSRAELDGAIAGYCAGLTEEHLRAPISYRNSAGREFSQPPWEILLHLFNHQTHQRGQVAQLLDERGIDNDLSNLVWYLRR